MGPSRSARGDEPRVSVAVFAHNEEHNVIACLESLYDGGFGRAIDVHVLSNGSTDRTEELVSSYASNQARVQLHRIALGDKSNAWNVYVHEHCSPSDVHVFVDGDVIARPGALEALARTLAETPAANGATALPDGGRNSGDYLAKAIELHGVAGNLYALRGGFVDRIRHAGVRLPIGLIGDDSWVGAFAKFDLDVRKGWRDDRIAVSTAARFHYESLQWYRLRDLRLYWRRRIRYALRTWQNAFMKEHLHERGIASLPTHVIGLYQAHRGKLQLRWSGTDTLFLWLARRRIVASLAAFDGARSDS